MRMPLNRRLAVRRTEVNGIDVVFKDDLEGILRRKRQAHFRLGNIALAREIDKILMIVEDSTRVGD